MKTASSDRSLPSAAALHEVNDGSLVITLCRVASSVSIRPPEDPELQRFSFFTSPSSESGSDWLHMGYFAVLSDAQKWLQSVRIRYPNATLGRIPSSSPEQPQTDVSAPGPRPGGAKAASEDRRDDPPLEQESLTDTQVMRILETRTEGEIEPPVDESTSSQVELLRPDDTDSRRILKEAVAKGAPVSFAVQLFWSAQPIDLQRVPPLSIFKAYTLYRTESRREGRCCYFLRLGFFKDAISAKQVASHVRSEFASAAVVPVTEQELTHAKETRQDALALPEDPFERRVTQALDADRIGPEAAQRSLRAVPPVRRQTVKLLSSRENRAAGKKAAAASVSSRTSLERTLELLAQSETYADTDSISESGVRHLMVAVKKGR